MSAKQLIESVRTLLEANGFTLKMTAGRNLIAKVFFNKTYSAAIAAEQAGKLPPPQLFEQGLQDIQAKYDVRKRELVARLCQASIESLDQSTSQGRPMKTTEQIAAGILPTLPEITASKVNDLYVSLNKKGLRLHVITINTFNAYQGLHFRSIKTVESWYALIDGVEDSRPMVTAQHNNSVLFIEDDEGFADHQFMTWIFQEGKWTLDRVVHSMVDEDELNDTIEQVSGGGM